MFPLFLSSIFFLFYLLSPMPYHFFFPIHYTIFLISFPTYSSIIPFPDLFFFLSTTQLSPTPFLSYPLEYFHSSLINPSSTLPSTNPFRIQVIEVDPISYFFFFLSPIPFKPFPFFA